MAVSSALCLSLPEQGSWVPPRKETARVLWRCNARWTVMMTVPRKSLSLAKAGRNQIVGVEATTLGSYAWKDMVLYREPQIMTSSGKFSHRL